MAYRDELRAAFENPAQGGGENTTGLAIESSMGPLPVDKNFGARQYDGSVDRTGGGISLKDRAINTAVDAVAPAPVVGDWSPEAMKARTAREDARRALERELGAPPSGLEATPIQAFYAGEEGAKANSITSGRGDGGMGSTTGVPDVRNHARYPAEPNASALGNIFAPRDGYARRQAKDGDAVVRPGVVSTPDPSTARRPVPTPTPPVASERGTGRPVAPPNFSNRGGR